MIFVDTGAWFAVAVRDDPDHTAAMRWLGKNREPLVTTESWKKGRDSFPDPYLLPLGRMGITGGAEGMGRAAGELKRRIALLPEAVCS